MAGDYSRTTFAPSRDYAGVLMQQGRVTVDADFNELVDILDRRLRAEVLDMFGRCIVSGQTPDAFLITLAGGELTIGAGRAYVDGLLAENHGGDPLAYDPELGELRGTEPISYFTQPYLPNAAPLPGSGTYLAYLDVWRREVTALEDPQLVEKAIGVDTAARLQTVWQVKLLEAPDGTSCGGSVPGWDTLTAPSAGRLTTSAVGVPVSTDPCTIPPTGGYRGTENRLYRLEVHDPGPLGTATFKWSRDDASIAANVGTIDAAASELTLTRLGRDRVQRISIDDWVEVTDDWRELAGLAGEMRQVSAVDEVRQAITLSSPLPAGMFDATDRERHTRVTRWDQSGPAVDAAGGVVAVPGAAGTAIVLEDGVQVSFSDEPGGGDMRTGDYWMFAARTVDASVEQLVDAPPDGIQHHYCQLAVVSFPDGSTDCRQPPEGDHGDCACDVCVTPESHASGAMTIQHAVDLVRARGGKVCLQVGIYSVDEPVLIERAASLEIQGKGWKTILITNGAAPAMIIERSLGVTVDRLSILTSAPGRPGSTPSGIAILLRNTIGTIIERCAFLQLGMLQTEPPGGGDQPPPGGGSDPCPPDSLRAAMLKAELADFAVPFGPKGVAAPLIVLEGLVVETLIQENLLVGTAGIGQVVSGLYRPMLREAASVAPSPQELGRLMTYDLDIERNVLVCWLTGVSLEGFSIQVGDTRIAHNSLLACVRAGIVSTGMAGPGGRIDILANIVRVIGYGIAAGTSDTRIDDNDIARLQGLGASGREGSLVSLASAFDGSEGPSRRVVELFGGAAIVLVPGIRDAAIDRCQVRGNRVTQVVGDAISIRTMLATAVIADNQLAEVGGAGISMGGTGAAQELRVERNQVHNVGLLQDGGAETAAGIQLSAAVDVCVAGNTVQGVGLNSVAAAARWGIAVDSSQSVRITGNTVSAIGPAGEFTGLGAGIIVLDAFARADVLDNSVRRGSAQDKPQPLSRWFGIVIAGRAAAGGVKTVTGAFTVPIGGETFVFNPARGEIVRLPSGTASLAVRGNVVEAYGEAPAVLIETSVACLFNDNRCFLETRQGVPTARVSAGAAVTSNNYLQGTGQVPGLELFVPAGAPFTVLGNISAGGLALNGATPIPAPWDDLNVA